LRRNYIFITLTICAALASSGCKASQPHNGNLTKKGQNSAPIHSSGSAPAHALSPTPAPTAAPLPFTVATVPWKPRLDFHQTLEPKGDAVLIGVGQENYPAPTVDLSDYSDFAFSVGVNPSVIMLYQSVSDSPAAADAWADGIIAELDKISRSELILLQIGYDLLDETKLTAPGAHIPPIDGLVADTTQYDANIDGFCNALRKIGRPVYLRIGHEFNGIWNGYRADTYKASFKKIALKLRNKRCGVPLATVWNYSMDDNAHFESFYPGDIYVDWFGINIFGRVTQRGLDFMATAVAAGKPVMIGESTPRGIGAQNGWNSWFQNYFNFIYSNPSIKQFGYINWDWSNPAYGFAILGWGDTRIPANSPLAKKLNDELANRQYVPRLSGNSILNFLSLP
jgi:Glycosyl hydrolase family 26